MQKIINMWLYKENSDYYGKKDKKSDNYKENTI
jgi:hypothetical protein